MALSLVTLGFGSFGNANKLPTLGFFTAVIDPPAAPSGLVATTIDHQSVGIVWVDNSEDVAGVNEVQRFSLLGNAAIDTGTVTLAFDGESAEVPYSSLYDQSLFQAAIESIASIGPGNVSVTYNSESFYHDIEFIGGLAAMSLPEITVEASTLVDLYSGPVTPTITQQVQGSPLRWAEIGFYVQRSPDGSTNWTQVVDLGANLESWNDTGLSASTEYFYRIAAYNAGGQSSWSNTDSATTDAAPGGASSLYSETTITIGVSI